jgi:hypothetical protein
LPALDGLVVALVDRGSELGGSLILLDLRGVAPQVGVDDRPDQEQH